MTPRAAPTLDDLLATTAAERSEQTAVIDGSTTLTYADLLDRADSLASALIEAGIARGERVGVYMQKSWESVVAILGVSRAGATFVNVNHALKAAQVAHIAGDCDVRLFIGDSNLLDGLDPATVPASMHRGKAAPAQLPNSTLLDDVFAAKGRDNRRPLIETDLGTILYTSGSTGLPKGVAFSQRNLVVGAEIVSTYLENTADDRILSVLPFSFDYGLNQLTTAIRVGATLVCQRSQLPGDLLRSLRTHGITGLAGVPPVWALLLRNQASLEAEPLESLRYITNSGGRIPQANLDSLRRLLPATQIFLMYGLTEAFRSTYLPPDQIDRGSECIGRAIPNTEILVIKDGRECAPGEVGELVHRGPTVALGYWGNQEATDRVYKPNPVAPPELLEVERVVYSGDLVRKDEEGYLYFLGRNDAMIKSGGFRISPEEVENLLIASGVVHEACAFGVEDPDGIVGQVVVVMVSLRESAASDEDAAREAIRNHFVANAPSYMLPRDILVAEELPKGSSGKVDRTTIARAYRSSGERGAGVGPSGGGHAEPGS